MTRRYVVGLAVCSFALLTGCGGSSAGSPTSTPTIPLQTSRAHVTIVETKSGHPDALYVPSPIRILVGQTITWKNTDTDPHDVSADNGTFYSGPIGTDGQWRWTAKQPGTYTYTCTLHPDMHGTIIVDAVPTS
jgi:plastocyanin